MTEPRLAISCCNHGGSEGHSMLFGKQGVEQVIAEQIADSADIWPLLSKHGIDSVWVHIDLNALLSNGKRAATNASWNRKWRVRSSDRMFECWDVVLDGTPLVKTFRKDYAAGAAWLAVEVERLGRLALVQVAAHYGAERAQLEAIAKGQFELAEVLKSVPKTLPKRTKRFSVTVQISHSPTLHPNEVLALRASLGEPLEASMRKQRLGAYEGGESGYNYFSYNYLTTKPERFDGAVREHFAAARVDMDQVLICVEEA